MFNWLKAAATQLTEGGLVRSNYIDGGLIPDKSRDYETLAQISCAVSWVSFCLAGSGFQLQLFGL
jgi:hypothetical protein